MKLQDRVLAGEKLAFSRWGDGEWECVLFKGLANCDKHQYFYDMAYRLRKIMENKVTDEIPDYVFGMQDKAWNRYKFEITQYLAGFNCRKEFVDADVFHKMSEAGELMEWTKQLKNILLVANPIVTTRFPVECESVAVPILNAWLWYDKLLEEVKTKIKENSIVLVCAGMPGKILVDDLYHYGKFTILDMGSVYDPYCGLVSRNYMKGISL